MDIISCPRKKVNGPCKMEAGELVLSAAVLSILLTAPLGAFAMDRGGLKPLK